MKDTFRYKGLRQILVDKIRKKGITDESALRMINEIPRHLFMDNAFEQFVFIFFFAALGAIVIGRSILVNYLRL